MYQHFPQNTDLLKKYQTEIDFDKIEQTRLKQIQKLAFDSIQTFKQAVESTPLIKTEHLILNQDIIEIGHPDELNKKEQELVLKALKKFVPWKKGPFNIFGTFIDAEWRSDWKWNRIKPKIVKIEGRRIADIGCHNGYFLFRMAAEDPEILVGFEPFGRNFYNFSLMQRFAQIPSIQYELLGVEHIHYFPSYFDTILALGILYHHTDPITLLRKIHSSLRPGGDVIIDCQGIAGDDPISLTPQRRYANTRGIWNLPTWSCLKNWLSRSSFQAIEVFYNEPLSCEEQRATEWAPILSLKDFLNKENPEKTMEGYPAPHRIYVKARKL